MPRTLWVIAAVVACGCSASPKDVPARQSFLAASSAGASFRDCSECPELVVVSGGTFAMGSPEDEPGRKIIEGPVRNVTLRSFAVGRFPVTRGEWREFVTATDRPEQLGCAWTGRTGAKIDPAGSWRNLGFPQEDDHPVVCVSWSEVKDYLAWLTAKTGRQYRLLTEAEWEYAARGGAKSAYWWGDTASHEFANYGGDACCSVAIAGRDRWEYTSPVGAFPPNPFGLFDMSGNAMEWVHDCLSLSYAGLPDDGTAYSDDEALGDEVPFAAMKGSRSCGFRMLRGGDFNNPPALIRSAARNFAPPPDGSRLEDYRSGGLGFRVARSLN